jgi:flagellar hook protein FlgE
MLTSFSTALSALSADTTAIDVVGNNLANLNTPGFKTSTVSFHDLVTQSIGAGLGSTQVGFGVGVPITLRHFSQGAIQSTAGPLDAAIQGDGFFIVKTAQDATEYTRGGNLIVNTQGQLTTATGEVMQGWSKGDAGLDTNTPVGPITVPVGSLAPPQPTTAASVDLNLNATATAGPPPDSFSTSVEVFDSLGMSHIVTFTFTKAATPNKWTYSAGIPAADTGGTAMPVTGNLQFNGSGQLDVLHSDISPVIHATNMTDLANDMTVTWNLFNGNTSRITQFAQTSATSAVAQNGSPAANLVSVGIADGGTIVAKYSNGQQTVVGQLALATVRNPESLIAVGNSNYQLSARSALPAIGVPGSGGRGTVLGGSIEASTVDIAREFTELIVFQRGYQANSKIITTVDQISQDTINLKQ